MVGSRAKSLPRRICQSDSVDLPHFACIRIARSLANRGQGGGRFGRYHPAARLRPARSDTDRAKSACGSAADSR